MIQKIAVAGFSGPSKETGNAIADSLIPDLMEMGFIIVERNRLESVLAEQQIQQTGLTDASTAKKLGEMLNVDTILMGDYSTHVEKTEIPRNMWLNLGRGVHRGGPRVVHHARGRRLVFSGRFSGVMSVAAAHDILQFESLSLRLVSVQTGEILLTSARRTQFPASDLGDVLEDLMASTKKNLNL